MDAPALPEVDVLLDSLPDAVLFLDREAIVIAATPAVAELGGWSPEQLVGRAMTDLVSEDRADALRAELRRWAAGGASPLDRRTLQMALRTPSGEVVPAGVRMHRTERCFSVVIRRQAGHGGDLRARLLDATSAPVVTASGVAVAAAAVGGSFAWDIAAVWVVDTGTPTIRAVTVWERDPDPQRRHRAATLRQPFLAGEGLPGGAWQRGEVVTVESLDDDPRFGPGYGTTRRPRSGALIPLRSGRRTVGVLELFSFTELDPALWLDSESDAVSSGLGQLVERFRDRLQADAVEGRLALALDAGQLGVWTLDVRSGRAQWSARMAELHGIIETEGGADGLFAAVAPADRAVVGHALERARGVDEPQTVEYRVHDPDQGTGWISTRLTRVQTDGGPPLLSAVSSDVTDTKRAELSSQRRRAAVEGLQWVSQAIIAGRRLTDTAIAVANAATGVLGAEVGVVVYPEPGDVGSELAWAVAGLPGDRSNPRPPPHLEIGSVARTARGVETVADLRSSAAVRQFVADLGLPIDPERYRSALLVPIGGRGGRSLGLMVFLHADRRYFTEDDARMAASIGSTTGVAIENAQRHEQQRLAATAFQRQLLPRPDIDVPGIELCARYHPGRDGLDVGGDWYDVIALGDGRVGLAVGDVCGHGVTAAAHMGQFRYSFRALVQSSSTPQEALNVLNRLALEELNTTATLAYLELDPRSGAVVLWNCGHLPPVARAAGGDVRWLEDAAAGAPMLGFVPTLDVVPIHGGLDPGETLLLYTDGLVERRGEPIQRGLERLERAVGGVGGTVEELCDQLHRALAVPGPEADDTVLLSVRRR